jgi:diguanylate cyclase (GGDEF)-like protein
MATILVIDDSVSQRMEARAALQASDLFDRVLEARNGIEGLKLLVSEPVDLVLCDLEMPGLDGEKLLRMHASAPGASELAPFLVLTAVTDQKRRTALLKAGASDVITKPFHSADLMARIELHLKVVEARRELIAKNRELERLSTTDPLTELANRRLLEQVMAAEFVRFARTRDQFAIVLIDLDHFKRINDEYGHPAGDEVLVAVARTLDRMVRKSDCCGRFGGEEFLVVLTHNDGDGALVFAERLRRMIGDLEVVLPNGSMLRVTASLGVAASSPELVSSSALVSQADEALYRAKTAGRDCVRT